MYQLIQRNYEFQVIHEGSDVPGSWDLVEGKGYKTWKAADAAAAKMSAISHLRSFIKPGDAIYIVIDHVSDSGMSRHISAYAIAGRELSEEPYLQYITGWMATALGESLLNMPGHYNCYRVSGCGMDMAWHEVNRLSTVLFGYDCDNPLRSVLL